MVGTEKIAKEEEKLTAVRAAIAEEIFELVGLRQAYRQQNNMQLGRKFIETKETFTKHGQWTRHYRDVFESKIGIPLNTAQRYMRLAREADQKVHAALFEPATDTEAQEIQAASEAAKLEVDRKQRVTLHINLHLATAEERNALARLCSSSKWPSVERKLIKLLKRLHEETENEDLDSAA